MAREHLLKRSKKVYTKSDGKAWWYEEPAGMCIVHEIWIDGVLNRTDILHIPWDRVRGALQRLDRKTTTRAAPTEGDET